MFGGMLGGVAGIIIIIVAIYLILHLIHSLIKAVIIIVLLAAVVFFFFGPSLSLGETFNFLSDRTDISAEGINFNVLNSEKETVVRVLDGDTVELESGYKVRLLGINSPETGQPCSSEAKAKLEALVLNKEVILIPGNEDQDIYGRLLRYIVVDDTVVVNVEMVKSGYAHVYAYGETSEYIGLLNTAQSLAMKGKTCMWAESDYTDCFSIKQMNYDADGNDNENLNEEYIVFENKCDEVDMSGWTIKDESASNLYTFTNFVAGEEFTVYSGKGVATDSEIYWGRTQAVWNNEGDTLFLRDTFGNLVFVENY